MKSLTVDSSMRALIGGAFYPKGHTMVMYPSEDLAKDSAQLLLANGFTDDDIYSVPAADVIAQIAPTVDADNDSLPSIGSDGNEAREFVKLAREGQSGLLIATPDDVAGERLLKVLKQSHYSVASRYFTLVIEDL